jgi:hypothetical protein
MTRSPSSISILADESCPDNEETDIEGTITNSKKMETGSKPNRRNITMNFLQSNE